MALRRRLLLVLTTLALLISGILAGGAGSGAAQGPTPDAEIAWLASTGLSAHLQAELDRAEPGAFLSVIVTLHPQATLRPQRGDARSQRIEGVITALQRVAESTQGSVRAYLEGERRAGRVESVVPYWVLNGLAVRAGPEVIAALAARADVARVSLDERLALSAPDAPVPSTSAQAWQSSAAAEPNIALVNAPALWALGVRGQGVVVANMDTGVYLGHADLKDSWRGGTNSWYDPNGEHPAVPADLNGHGTATMGVMVGGDAGGTAIGMAPGARWIAVKIFDDAGVARTSAAHAGFQWLLDPDGDPSTPDAPDVVSNSWGYEHDPSCITEFSLDLSALRAAGILPVFSAGNDGPAAGTGTSPGNNLGAFPVGATDNSDQICNFSSRGPSACYPASPVFPALTAPGLRIRCPSSTGPLAYALCTGTSFAAPHVAGGLALLLSALPDLTVEQQEAALQAGAVDLGPAGPDMDYGAGRLDVLASYRALTGATTPTPPTPTPAVRAGNPTEPPATEFPTVPPPTPTPTPTPPPPVYLPQMYEYYPVR